MSAALVISFLVSLCFFHGSVRCDVTTQKSDEVPFKPRCSITCETTPQEKPSEEIFPLYQCSCSRSCLVYGDCCFDSKYKNETVWHHKTDFICFSVIDHGKYRAVFSCPPDQLSDFCIDGLGHLPPVTSKATNITYANIFCAACNGERDNLVTWNVELSCSSEEVVEEPPNSSTRIIYHLGDVWRLNVADGSKKLCMYRVHFGDFSFLTGLKLRSCAQLQKISDCSASWRDLQTMQMCRSYEDPVYFHNTMYRNSHCAECNYLNPVFADCMPFHVKTMLQMGLIDSDVGRFCQNRGSDACIQTLSNTQKGRTYAFSDLLNIEEKVCIPPEGKRCCAGERFDFRTRRCRKTTRG